MAAYVNLSHTFAVNANPPSNFRAASKDPELEGTYLKLLKETSTHEKAITRDLGR